MRVPNLLFVMVGGGEELKMASDVGSESDYDIRL